MEEICSRSNCNNTVHLLFQTEVTDRSRITDYSIRTVVFPVVITCGGKNQNALLYRLKCEYKIIKTSERNYKERVYKAFTPGPSHVVLYISNVDVVS